MNTIVNEIPDTGGDALASLRASAAVVIPCYNAGHRVRGVVEAALRVVDRVIVVDDGSTDGGTRDLEHLAATVIRFEQNRGKGAALLAGFRAALDKPETACVVVVDADGQHDPFEVPALHDAFVRSNADLVIGARTLDQPDVPWRSRFGNRLTVFVTGWLFGRRLPDTQSGFRLLSKSFAESIVASLPEGRYETEMAIIVKAIRERREILSIPIKTIYEAGNMSSHFRKISDSLRIYRVLLGAAIGAKSPPLKGGGGDVRSDIAPKSAQRVWRMFDAIAPRYDLLNRLLSFGQDVQWRRLLIGAVSDARFARVLDVATGTGDVLLAAGNGCAGAQLCVGADAAGEMLARARLKIGAQAKTGCGFVLMRCDAEALPLAAGSFDAATIAFGIRNVSDPCQGLREMCRVLAPGGRLAVLEFSLPSARIVRAAYLLYFRCVLPRIGGWISGDYAAYRYLNRSVESFPYGKAFCDMMTESGFEDVAARPLTCGIATLYTGEKTRG